MAVLLHGTTRQRAERIIALGPDPHFMEPRSTAQADGFSTYLEEGPFYFGTPQEYACSKAATFPDEGGAVILVMQVPDDLVALAVDDLYFPLSQGLVQFDAGRGLEELRARRPACRKTIRNVACP